MNIEYITKPGERWDNVAYKAYGTIGNIITDDGTEVNAISYIINNNPDVVTESILPDSTLLNVPIIARLENKTASELLPIWKQA